MAFTNLLLSDPQLDHLADAIELGIEEAHALTVENAKGSELYEQGIQAMKALTTVLEQFDDENPILDAECAPGVAFDWDAFWVGVEEAELADEEGDDADDDISVAPSPLKRVV
jgi:hypothetical protein